LKVACNKQIISFLRITAVAVTLLIGHITIGIDRYLRKQENICESSKNC
jgi:hypothetical protein